MIDDVQDFFARFHAGMALSLCDGEGRFLSHLIVQEVVLPGRQGRYGDLMVEASHFSSDPVRMTFRYVFCHPELANGWYRPLTAGPEGVRTVSPDWQQEPCWNQRDCQVRVPYQLTCL